MMVGDGWTIATSRAACYRVSDDGWKHLSNDVIASIHSFPPKWIAVMRRMAMACEHVCQAARGDLPAEDESSEEDDDTESDDE